MVVVRRKIDEALARAGTDAAGGLPAALSGAVRDLPSGAPGAVKRP